MRPSPFLKGGVCLAKETVMNMKSLQETGERDTVEWEPSVGHQVSWLSVSVEILMGEGWVINPMPGG